jgi:DNA-binding winged helix-turn-helix (wHTH) protein/Tfp pilus assembly protein PilF
MHGGNTVFRFGPFELDSARRCLIRGGRRVALPDRHVEILLLLTGNAGQIVSKEALLGAAWRGVAVGDNSVEKAISRVRKALGRQRDGALFIETLPLEGYRFAAPVERRQARQSDEALDALLVPYRAFVDGRAALETFDRDAVIHAREAFENALRAVPDHPGAHVGLANACVQSFESTRADAAPDVASLEKAVHHAREGCRLAESWGEAWSTLGFVLHRCGDAREAGAAARKGVTLEPDDWRHYLRLASVTWGEERLRAARRVLALRPGLALAHWFAATVFVARQTFDFAIQELRTGCAAQDAQRREGTRFKAVGLHLLHGLVLAAAGAVEAALDEFERELACGTDTLVYARECRANTWYAVGALRLRRGHADEARGAFQRALEQVPGHPLAAVGLGAMSRSSHSLTTHDETATVEAAVVKAAVLALQGRHHEAARVYGDALVQAEPGSAGWIVPVDPLLNTAAHCEEWTQSLELLRARAD